MSYRNILNCNIYDPVFKDKFLIIGTCLEKMYPKILNNFEKEWKNIVRICLEQDHYNQLVAKLFDTLGAGNSHSVGFLTVDGSPHCVQVHYASKYLKRGLKVKVKFVHYVIEKSGKVFKVSMEEIDKSRNLSLVGEKVKV
jgi:hypothetical protein